MKFLLRFFIVCVLSFFSFCTTILPYSISKYSSVYNNTDHTIKVYFKAVGCGYATRHNGMVCKSAIVGPHEMIYYWWRSGQSNKSIIIHDCGWRFKTRGLMQHYYKWNGFAFFYDGIQNRPKSNNQYFESIGNFNYRY